MNKEEKIKLYVDTYHEVVTKMFEIHTVDGNLKHIFAPALIESSCKITIEILKENNTNPKETP